MFLALSFYCSWLFHIYCFSSVENMSAASCFYFRQLEYSVYKMLFTYIISYTTLSIKHHPTFTDEKTRVQKNEATYSMSYYNCIKCRPHISKFYTCIRLHCLLFLYYTNSMYLSWLYNEYSGRVSSVLFLMVGIIAGL